MAVLDPGSEQAEDASARNAQAGHMFAFPAVRSRGFIAPFDSVYECHITINGDFDPAERQALAVQGAPVVAAWLDRYGYPQPLTELAHAGGGSERALRLDGLLHDALAVPVLVALMYGAGALLLRPSLARSRERRRQNALAHQLCPQCRYDIRNLPYPHCPECGEPLHAETDE